MSGKKEHSYLFATGCWSPKLATFAVICLGLVACCISCSTPAETKRDDQQLASTWRDGLEFPRPLVDDLISQDVAVAAKIELDHWERVQSFFDSAAQRMSKLAGRGANPRANPVNVLLDQLGDAAVYDHINKSRSLYLVLSNQTSQEWEACLVTGLFCPEQADRAPLFGRVWLAVTDAAAVEEALREEFGDYIIVGEYNDYLRMDFFYNAPADSELARQMLEQRAAQGNHPARERITPTLVRFLRFDGALAGYGRFDGLLGWGKRLEAILSEPSDAPASGADALAGRMHTAYRVNGPGILHDPESAQFEDVGLFLRATSDGGLRLDLAMTPTPLGAETARAARLEAPIPPLPQMEVLVEAGFAANIARVGEIGRVPRWTEFTGDEVLDYHRQMLPWSALAVLSAPSFSVESFFPEYMQYYSGVAGRMRVGSMPEPAALSTRDPASQRSRKTPLSLETLRGAVFFTVDSSMISRAEVHELSGEITEAGFIEEVEVAEMSANRIEVRGGYPSSEPDWFDRPDHPPEHAAASFRFAPDGSEFARSFFYGISEASGLSWLNLLNELRWSFAGRAQWHEQGFHLTAYLGPGDGPAADEWPLERVAGFERRQPASTCFDQLFRLGAHGLTSAQMPLDEYVAHLDAIETQFLERADRCAEAAENPQLARLAQAHFFWSRAQLARHLPEEGRVLPALEEACARGMERACREMDDAK